MLNEQPDQLFHYCSIETFLNIIKNRTIRLSDIGKSNDYLETKWLMEYFEDEVISQYQDKPFLSNNVIYGLNDIDAIKFLAKNEKQKVLKRTDHLFYVACFSENGDKLSQWRGYADDGCGISIGFNTNVLKELSEKDNMMILGKVIYPETSSPPNPIKEYAQYFLSGIQESLYSGDSAGIFFNDYASNFLLSISSRVLYKDSIFYKNPAFAEEEEWRLVMDDELSKDDDWQEWYDKEEEKPSLSGSFAERFPRGLDFYVSNKKIVSFFDLSFKGYEDDIIEQIIVGPKSLVDEDDIHHILTYYGYNDFQDIKIEKSKSTYR